MATGSEDGRTRRTARSRAAIEHAMFELVGEGVLQPTAQQVAARAGVALRSVFRHFNDLDGLFAALDRRVRSDVIRLVRDPDPGESLADRQRRLVHQRAELFARIAPYKRSADSQRWHSAFLDAQHRRLVREQRARLLRWLPELATSPADVLDAVDLALSFEAWARLRWEQRLSQARAIAVMERTVAALLPPDRPSGGRRAR